MDFIRNVISELGQYLIAPFIEPQMWWVIGPVFLVMIVLALYFATHETEKIGWNTALTNSAVLVFVGIDLIRNVFNYTNPADFNNFFDNPYKLLVIFIIMVEGLLLSYSAFRHALPEKLMFFIASPLVINVQVYVLIVLVYLRVDPTRYTIFAALLLFAILLFAFWFLSRVIRKNRALKENGIVESFVVHTSGPENSVENNNVTTAS